MRFILGKKLKLFLQRGIFSNGLSFYVWKGYILEFEVNMRRGAGEYWEADFVAISAP